MIITKKMEELKENYYELKLLLLKINMIDCEINKKASQIWLKPKQKYVYVDFGDGKHNSGKWLIDKDNNVWSIKSYGKKNRIIGTIEEVTKNIKVSIFNLTKYLKQKEETSNGGRVEYYYT